MPDSEADRIADQVATDPLNRILIARADLARAVTNLWDRYTRVRDELEKVELHRVQPDQGSWLDAHTEQTP